MLISVNERRVERRLGAITSVTERQYESKEIWRYVFGDQDRPECIFRDIQGRPRVALTDRAVAIEV